ncbi:MAG: NAD(P)H-quinone oxidoreductase subunit N, partial [Cyanobacteria bacterium J06639_1]
SYLTRTHGVRPAHVGKSERRTYYFPPLIDQYAKTLPPDAKGLVFWLIEGHVFSQSELTYLTRLAASDARVRFVVEVESDRKLRWRPLAESAA